MLFYIIYHMPLWLPIFITFFGVIIWASMMDKLSEKRINAVRYVNIVLTVIAVVGIMTITIVNRSAGKSEVMLIPFHSFIEAREQKEVYRSMLMNVFLFVPFGLCLPYSLKNVNRKILLTVIIALIISMCIEIYQFAFSCGRCETDDVICNTFGAFIGSLSYFLFHRMCESDNNKQLHLK